MSDSRDAAPIDLAHEADFPVGTLKVSPSTREVVNADGTSEILEPRIMQVLVALARRRGQILSRDDLIRDCWNGRIVGEDALNRCIARVRRLAEAGGGFTVETVPRVGYRLREAAVAGAISSPVSPRPRPRLALAAALAAVVILAGIAIAVWLTRPAAPIGPAAAPRIAVVPFDALGSQEDLRVFGDGVSEQILGVLGDNQVQSVSRFASVALRGPDRDAAAGDLGAQFIVDGTVAHGDAGLHVTVHLDHVATHVTLWTASFDQASADPPTLQAQVAAKIVDVVKAALAGIGWQGGAIGDVALSDYISAMDHVRMIPARQHMAQALELFHAVVANAPNFSLGHSGVAMSSIFLAGGASPQEARTLLSDARSATARALALDPHNGEVYLALALMVPSRHWAEREALFRKGLSVEPDNAALSNYLGTYYAQEGRVAESLPLKQRSLMLDPLSPVKTASLAYAFASAGQCADATAAIDRAAKLWPAQPLIWVDSVYILGNCGREGDVPALFAKPSPPSLDLESGFFDAWRAYLNALATQTAGARAHAIRTVLAARRSGLSGGAAIEMLAQLGDVDAAFAAADALYPANPKPNELLYTDLLFARTTASMRRDGRFMPLMQRLGLTALWTKSGRWPDFCSEPGLPYDCAAAVRAR